MFVVHIFMCIHIYRYIYIYFFFVSCTDVVFPLSFDTSCCILWEEVATVRRRWRIAMAAERGNRLLSSVHIFRVLMPFAYCTLDSDSQLPRQRNHNDFAMNFVEEKKKCRIILCYFI